MKLKEKLADQHVASFDQDTGGFDVRSGFLAGFEKARELAGIKIRYSVNLSGIERPSDEMINCSLQSQHDAKICDKLGEEEIENE